MELSDLFGDALDVAVCAAIGLYVDEVRVRIATPLLRHAKRRYNST